MAPAQGQGKAAAAIGSRVVRIFGFPLSLGHQGKRRVSGPEMGPSVDPTIYQAVRPEALRIASASAGKASAKGRACAICEPVASSSAPGPVIVSRIIPAPVYWRLAAARYTALRSRLPTAITATTICASRTS